MLLNIFPTLEIAEQALTAINNNERFPSVGLDANTGILQPEKTKTEVWFPVEDIYALTDGRFGFPKVSDERLEYVGVTQEESQQWANYYGAVVEDASDLMPIEEEEV